MMRQTLCVLLLAVPVCAQYNYPAPVPPPPSPPPVQAPPPSVASSAPPPADSINLAALAPANAIATDTTSTSFEGQLIMSQYAELVPHPEYHYVGVDCSSTHEFTGRLSLDSQTLWDEGVSRSPNDNNQFVVIEFSDTQTTFNMCSSITSSPGDSTESSAFIRLSQAERETYFPPNPPSRIEPPNFPSVNCTPPLGCQPSVTTTHTVLQFFEPSDCNTTNLFNEADAFAPRIVCFCEQGLPALLVTVANGESCNSECAKYTPQVTMSFSSTISSELLQPISAETEIELKCQSAVEIRPGSLFNATVLPPQQLRVIGNSSADSWCAAEPERFDMTADATLACVCTDYHTGDSVLQPFTDSCETVCDTLYGQCSQERECIQPVGQNCPAKDQGNNALCTDGNSLFLDCSFTGRRTCLPGWDVSTMTNFDQMFLGTNFNEDIGRWNVSAATNMNQMFFSAAEFNQDISHWDVSNVDDFSGMFGYASAFNQDISGWNISAAPAANLFDIFLNANAFISGPYASKTKSCWEYLNEDLTEIEWDLRGVPDYVPAINSSNYDAECGPTAPLPPPPPPAPPCQGLTLLPPSGSEVRSETEVPLSLIPYRQCNCEFTFTPGARTSSTCLAACDYGPQVNVFNPNLPFTQQGSFGVFHFSAEFTEPATPTRPCQLAQLPLRYDCTDTPARDGFGFDGPNLVSWQAQYSRDGTRTYPNPSGGYCPNSDNDRPQISVSECADWVDSEYAPATTYCCACGGGTNPDSLTVHGDEPITAVTNTNITVESEWCQFQPSAAVGAVPLSFLREAIESLDGFDNTVQCSDSPQTGRSNWLKEWAVSAIRVPDEGGSLCVCRDKPQRRATSLVSRTIASSISVSERAVACTMEPLCNDTVDIDDSVYYFCVCADGNTTQPQPEQSCDQVCNKHNLECIDVIYNDVLFTAPELSFDISAFLGNESDSQNEPSIKYLHPQRLVLPPLTLLQRVQTPTPREHAVYISSETVPSDLNQVLYDRLNVSLPQSDYANVFFKTAAQCTATTSCTTYSANVTEQSFSPDLCEVRCGRITGHHGKILELANDDDGAATNDEPFETPIPATNLDSCDSNYFGIGLVHLKRMMRSVLGYPLLGELRSMATTEVKVVTASNGAYSIDDQLQPSLSLQRGRTYIFYYPQEHPLRIGTDTNDNPLPESHGHHFDDEQGFLIFSPIYSGTFYYYCTNHNNMGNNISIGDDVDTELLNSFWTSWLHIRQSKYTSAFDGPARIDYSPCLSTVVPVKNKPELRVVKFTHEIPDDFQFLNFVQHQTISGVDFEDPTSYDPYEISGIVRSLASTLLTRATLQVKLYPLGRFYYVGDANCTSNTPVYERDQRLLAALFESPDRFALLQQSEQPPNPSRPNMYVQDTGVCDGGRQVVYVANTEPLQYDADPYCTPERQCFGPSQPACSRLTSDFVNPPNGFVCSDYPMCGPCVPPRTYAPTVDIPYLSLPPTGLGQKRAIVGVQRDDFLTIISVVVGLVVLALLVVTNLACCRERRTGSAYSDNDYDSDSTELIDDTDKAPPPPYNFKSDLL